MKRMTYNTLMKKIEDGYAEINAWEGSETNGTSHADVRFYNAKGESKREIVEVTKIPAEHLR